MSVPFQIHTADALHPHLDRRAIITTVRQALIAHSNGQVQSPMPGQLTFPESPGDCHIKFAHQRGGSSFGIKVATGFYNNPLLGLPVNNGLMMLFDAATGAPQHLFLDQGLLTAWRTAAAVALAVDCLSPNRAPCIGIIGTGQQARLATEWVPMLLPDAHFVIHGRSDHSAKLIAKSCGGELAYSVEDLLARADCVLTTTPSSVPLFTAEQARSATHFVAVGADGDGKQELPAALFARATHIVVDDRRQCFELSDTGKAIEAKEIDPDAVQLLGHILDGTTRVNRRDDDISIVDLTGLAAQDVAIATFFVERLVEEFSFKPA